MGLFVVSDDILMQEWDIIDTYAENYSVETTFEADAPAVKATIVF